MNIDFNKCLPVILCALFSCKAMAGCGSLNRCDENNWRLIVGGQYTHRSPEMHYESKDTPPRVVDIKEDFTEERYLPFPFLKLEYKINKFSSLDVTYNQDDTQTSALERKTVKFLFFPLKIGVRTPLEIDTKSLKFRYNRSIWQSDDWDLGASLGLQVLKVDVKAQIPISGEENENLIAPLPNFGAYVNFWQSDKLSYRLRADYLPLKFQTTKGDVAEVDFSAEYQYNQTWLFGAGYRYTYLNLEFDRDSYRADVTHSTYGPTVFVGASF